MKRVTLRVNGRFYETVVSDNERLMDVLRNHLAFKSVKEGCGVGDCGLCIVLMNGRPVNSCLILAAKLNGDEIVTVEGLGSEANLHPLQKAFIDVGASQCGYCIPAALLISHHLLAKTPNPTSVEIRRSMRSVLCRCGSYLRFEEAIRVAATND